MISKKRNSFATNVAKSMEITNLGSTTSRAIASSTNAKLVHEASKHPEVLNTTWLCIPVLPPSIAASAAKPSLLATNCCCIKNQDTPTKDLILANGAAKASCWLINWPNIVGEFTPAKSLSNATCANSGSRTQGTVFSNFFWNLKLIFF